MPGTRPATSATDLEAVPAETFSPLFFTDDYGNLPIVIDDDRKPVKPLFWIGSARKDYSAFPADVQDDVGYALYRAQLGGKHDAVKPLKGFGDAGVLEVVTAHAGDAFRTVYTVRFAKAVYVLHAFQKKSKAGAQTPKPDIDLVRTRLKVAKDHHDELMEHK